jgi:mannosyltransferase OCH1-like enzyme
MRYTRKAVPKRIISNKKTRSAIKKQTATIETQTEWITPERIMIDVSSPLPIVIDPTLERIEIPHYIPKRQDATIEKNSNTIPLIIYQTWNSTCVPLHMANNIVRLLTTNPEFDYYLYDDLQSREFILYHFGQEVANAYDALIPGAYKSDLWRYCVLYINGGFYLDMKFYSAIPLIKLLEYGPTIFVKDLHTVNSSSDDLYNAFMASTPNNEIFKHCIKDIVLSCKFKLYHRTMLDITGPGLLGRMMMKYYPELFHSYIKDFKLQGDCIMKSEQTIFAQYPEYREEQRRFQTTPHYGGLYFARQVYH